MATRAEKWLARQLARPVRHIKGELKYRAEKRHRFRRAYRKAEMEEVPKRATALARMRSKEMLKRKQVKFRAARETIRGVKGIFREAGAMADMQAYYNAIGYRPAGKKPVPPIKKKRRR